MNLSYTHLIPSEFNQNSRVWIYQSNRLFTIQEALDIENMLNDFTEQWKSHGNIVKGFATLFFGQFIIIMADEEKTGVSGCSTDSSVKTIKSLESRFNVSFFDRTTLAFFSNNNIELLPLNQVQYAISNGFITADTLFFDHSVTTKMALLTRWIIPLKESWLWKRLQQGINS